MHPDHVHLTAVNMPLGLYEWLVMPMGLKNALAIHQRCVTAALRMLIGKFCHIYLDNIVIWSNSLEEHERNVRAVLKVLCTVQLYVNPDKIHPFCTEIDFPGHHISACSIEADNKKIDRILNWPVPKSATEVRGFLGLVRYIAAFLPSIVDHMGILSQLTMKDSEKNFSSWMPKYQVAFDVVKQIVTSCDCLTTIDFSKMPDHKIFVMMDASDKCSGAVLSFGPSWETAHPITFDSMTFKNAELNYPVHEKELLTIIHALKKWHVNLLGSPFLIYTDHKTLENFNIQKDLSQRQACWMEFMSQFDAKVVYIKGKENTVANALSHLPSPDVLTEAQNSVHHLYNFCDNDDDAATIVCVTLPCLWGPWESATHLSSHVPFVPLICSTLEIMADKSFLDDVRSGYIQDAWCKTLPATAVSWPELVFHDGLWYIGDRLIIPCSGNLQETLFMLAHDVIRHFSFYKTYSSLCNAYYWPNMQCDLEQGYIASCPDCQRNKSSTTKPYGPLHPLPIPDQRGDSMAIDFIGPLPEDNRMNSIITFTNHLGSDIQLIPSQTNISTEELAYLFFNKWYCENGLPSEIISDRDKLFISRFWKSLHKLTGIKLKLSTAYHPETDGTSERTNKTVNQKKRSGNLSWRIDNTTYRMNKQKLTAYMILED